jgi:hypothetical protein
VPVLNRFAGAVAVFACLAAGCTFTPSIGEGTIKCGTQQSCPPGFTCSALNGFCYANPPTLGDGGCNPFTCEGLHLVCGDASDGCGGTLHCTCAVGVCVPGPHCCVPATCDGKCGSGIPDGCLGTLNCGTCSNGETCGGGGLPFVCGKGTCMPRTCQQQGKQCGMLSDGCSTMLNCGGCFESQCSVCTSTANMCTCVPSTCAQLGRTCGYGPDGCGGLLNCGNCLLPSTCDGTTGKCTCTKKTMCGPMDCGNVSDGCGGFLSCGGGCRSCTPIQCTPGDCGRMADGCGNKIDCGSCPSGQSCGVGAPNRCGCLPATCGSKGTNCGTTDDGCGGQLVCGTCPAGFVCGTGNVCVCN